MRKICAATAVMGESIELFFNNSEFFVDFFTSYYTDVEPQSAFVVEYDGRVVGYLLGCTNVKKYLLYQFMMFWKLILKVLKGICLKKYNKNCIKFFWWLMWKSWREIPCAPMSGAHFHFNILKGYRGISTTKRLVEAYVTYLKEKHPNIKIVWGQMEVFENRRMPAVFERFGWKLYDKVPFSKYKYMMKCDRSCEGEKLGVSNKKLKSKVFLATIYKQL
ncbi:hypothetical protein M1N70_00500 [Peptococcaceae bacterium]|nr:hypothetical protein [Peptococcaceae bacterium]MCL0107472.1 hypothetical protein [Peptococcaceae bacterium]